MLELWRRRGFSTRDLAHLDDIATHPRVFMVIVILLPTRNNQRVNGRTQQARLREETRGQIHIAHVVRRPDTSNEQRLDTRVVMLGKKEDVFFRMLDVVLLFSRRLVCTVDLIPVSVRIFATITSMPSAGLALTVRSIIRF